MLMRQDQGWGWKPPWRREISLISNDTGSHVESEKGGWRWIHLPSCLLKPLFVASPITEPPLNILLQFLPFLCHPLGSYGYKQLAKLEWPFLWHRRAKWVSNLAESLGWPVKSMGFVLQNHWKNPPCRHLVMKHFTSIQTIFLKNLLLKFRIMTLSLINLTVNRICPFNVHKFSSLLNNTPNAQFLQHGWILSIFDIVLFFSFFEM